MRKKSLFCMLSMVLLSALFIGMAMPAMAASSATMSVATVQTKAGDTVIVDVSLDCVAAGIQFELGHDPAVLTLEKIEAGPQFPNGWLQDSKLTTGRFIGASAKNETINGVIARYTYKVNSDAAMGDSALNVIDAKLAYASSTGVADIYPEVLSEGLITVVSSDASNTTTTNESDPSDTSNAGDPSNTINPSDPSNNNTNNGSDPSKGVTNSPKTGDSGAWMFVTLFVISLLGIVIYKVVITKKQKS